MQERVAAAEQVKDTQAPDDHLLYTDGLTKKFGSFVAIDNVELAVDEDTVHAIIGPNGAGKTTFFNLLAGSMKPTNGQIYFQGKDVTSRQEHKRAQDGICRSFQISHIFPELTVYDNLCVAAQSKQQSLRLLDRIKPESKDDASKMLRDLNLTDLKDKHVSEVSHGNKKAIEIGMATLTEPELLLLDEPTSGVSGSESQSILEFISQISEQMTILFVEHDVDMVLDISDIITVFDHGKAIAEGSPEEIQENEQVQEAYLGGV